MRSDLVDKVQNFELDTSRLLAMAQEILRGLFILPGNRLLTLKPLVDVGFDFEPTHARSKVELLTLGNPTSQHLSSQQQVKHNIKRKDRV